MNTFVVALLVCPHTLRVEPGSAEESVSNSTLRQIFPEKNCIQKIKPQKFQKIVWTPFGPPLTQLKKKISASMHVSDRVKILLVFVFSYTQTSHRLQIQYFRGSRTRDIIDKNHLAIFYNVYIKENDTARGIKIINEQLQARASSPTLASTMLYYNHIGDTNARFPHCEPCVRLNISLSGNEVMTLQALHRYCGANPNARVIYIHSKGTYTSTTKNDKLRKVLTKGAFSDLCAHMPRKGKGSERAVCNVCAAKFNAIPFHASPGNMFVAECSYVNLLIEPRHYAQKREKMMKELHSLSSSSLDSLGFLSQPSIRWQFFRPSWIGLERYAMEHWICSHPSFQGCDVYNNSFSYMNPPNVDDLREGLARAPRGTINDNKMPLHPFFLLKGVLHAYKKIYNATPPSTSWIYKFYD